jgi:hypothetical protein
MLKIHLKITNKVHIGYAGHLVLFGPVIMLSIQVDNG